MQMAFPICIYGAGVAQRLYKGLPRDGPGFDYRLGRCKDPAARPSQGTVNGVPSLNDLAVDGTLNTTNQPTLFESFYSNYVCEIFGIKMTMQRAFPICINKRFNSIQHNIIEIYHIG